jgi:hypothetical protein
MDTDQDDLNFIVNLLESKSTAKQKTYKHLLAAFTILSTEAQRVAVELDKRAKPSDKDVTIEFKEVGEHEFHLKLAGDLLVFVLHTNVVTFDAEHFIMKDDYMRQQEVNRYFGQIMIYNFMSDSLKFNRVNDPGYLLARIMINHENRFFIEGEGQLSTLFNKISDAPLTDTVLNALVKFSLAIAIENDLVAMPYPQVKFITLHQKQEHTPDLGGGHKIGFKMKYNG